MIDALGADISPAQEVCALAEAKARDVARGLIAELQKHHEESGAAASPGPHRYVVVGSDSMLEIGGRMVGKPHSAQVAVERIREMRGQDATLWTGHCVILICSDHRVNDAGQTHDATHQADDANAWHQCGEFTEPAATIVHFGQMSDAEIDAYVATGEPLEVAGSFTIDALGGPFIEGVTGDPHAVVGLSLPLMRKLVNRFGIQWPELWG